MDQDSLLAAGDQNSGVDETLEDDTISMPKEDLGTLEQIEIVNKVLLGNKRMKTALCGILTAVLCCGAAFAADVATSKENSENTTASTQKISDEKFSEMIDSYLEKARSEDKNVRAGARVAAVIMMKSGTAEQLHTFAKTILADPAKKHRENYLVQDVAKEANKLASGRDWQILETLGTVQLQLGNYFGASRSLQKALQQCDREDAVEGLKKQFAVCEKGIKEKTVIGRQSGAWNLQQWINLPEGKTTLNPADFEGKVVYLYCFQSWCPGCLRHGFPTLKKVKEHYRNNDRVAFVVIQTVFEGAEQNTFENGKAVVVDKFGLDIPYGQSGGKGIPEEIMKRYKTGGTPWSIIIGPDGIVRYSHFYIENDEAIEVIDELLDSPVKK